MSTQLSVDSTSEKLSLHTNSSDYVRLVALELFVARGFKGVSLRQLASAVGLQAGSLYSHIDSKDALLSELIDDYESELLHLLFKCVENDGSALEKLRSYTDTYIRFLIDNRDSSILTRYEFRSLRPSDKERVGMLRDRYQNLLRRILLDGVAEKIFDIEDIAVTAHGLTALLDGVTCSTNVRCIESADWLVKLIQDIVARTVGVSSF